MRKFGKVSMIVIIVMGIFISGWAFAQGQTSGGGQPRGANLPPPPDGGPPPNDGFHLLMKYEMDNIAIAVIANLSGQSVATVQTALEQSDVRKLLETYSVNETLFQEAMNLKIQELVNEALTNNRITQAQADLIIEKLSSQP